MFVQLDFEFLSFINEQPITFAKRDVKYPGFLVYEVNIYRIKVCKITFSVSGHEEQSCCVMSVIAAQICIAQILCAYISNILRENSFDICIITLFNDFGDAKCFSTEYNRCFVAKYNCQAEFQQFRKLSLFGR